MFVKVALSREIFINKKRVLNRKVFGKEGRFYWKDFSFRSDVTGDVFLKKEIFKGRNTITSEL